MDVYSELVESLENCVAACNNCASSSLNQEDVQALTACIKLTLDCGDVCQIALNLLARDSRHVISVVEICRDICLESIEECARHDYDHCKICVRACRRCCYHCRNYLERIAEPV